ncbi:amino acid ABC transporter permease [Labrys monachus]|uniref:Polar amino acid transport system permease protein n=1 Tax=Labrys monachus TaxID=217067 RepID=A0ABU0F7F0_9HYPH|nr:amino acid ABC transporter permease [Labrys monachus]MDQ0390500.1 polar amino acid transport system permease protein [Labrys monachus]
MTLWNWPAFLGYLGSPFLLAGAWTTIWLTAVSAFLGLVLGALVAAARMSRFASLRNAAGFYVWVMRGTPLLVQLVIIFTGLPQFGIRLSVIMSAIVGLALNEAAYLSEIIRGAVQSIPRGQRNAGLALGLTPAQTMRDVVLPQAVRIMLPMLGNSVNGLLKATSITSAISMEELLRRTNLLIQEQFLTLELFAVASIYYLAMTSVWSLAQGWLERRFSRGHDFGGRYDNAEQR